MPHIDQASPETYDRAGNGKAPRDLASCRSQVENPRSLQASLSAVAAKSSGKLERTFGAATKLQALNSRLERELGSRYGATRGRYGYNAQRRDFGSCGLELSSSGERFRYANRVLANRSDQAFGLRIAQPDYRSPPGQGISVWRYSSLHSKTWPQLVAEQGRATQRALALDPDNDLALIAKSMMLKNYYGDASQALAIDQAVLKRSPNFGPAHYSMSGSLWMLGRPRQSIDHIDKAIDLDPFDIFSALRAKFSIHWAITKGTRRGDQVSIAVRRQSDTLVTSRWRDLAPRHSFVKTCGRSTNGAGLTGCRQT